MTDDWVTVVTASGRLEAEILRGLLEAADIRTWLVHESAATAVGLGVGLMAQVEVRVPEGDAEEARRTLNDYYDGSLEDDEGFAEEES